MDILLLYCCSSYNDKRKNFPISSSRTLARPVETSEFCPRLWNRLFLLLKIGTLLKFWRKKLAVFPLRFARNPDPKQRFLADNTFKREDKIGKLSLYVAIVDLMMGEDLTNLLAEAPTWNLREGEDGNTVWFCWETHKLRHWLNGRCRIVKDMQDWLSTWVVLLKVSAVY